MATYIHELKDWPAFRWNEEELTGRLASVRHRQGRLIGRMEALGFQLQAEAVLQTLTEDVLKSSEIEGEVLDKDQVRSSIARRPPSVEKASPSRSKKTSPGDGAGCRSSPCGPSSGSAASRSGVTVSSPTTATHWPPT